MFRWAASTLASLLVVSFVSAAKETTVSVTEIGNGPACVRHTTGSKLTTIEGVKSFWRNLHLKGDGFVKQIPDMSLVPDFFNRPDGGVIVHLKNIDWDDVASSSLVVRSDSSDLIPDEDVETLTDADSFRRSLLEKIGSESKLDIVSLDASDISSSEITSVLNSIQSAVSGKVVLHIVSEREVEHRRLDDRDENEDNEDNEDKDGENQGDDDAYTWQKYGYYDNYANFVTNYKTMGQIQYFNVVVGTTFMLLYAVSVGVYKLMYMPLMADTLLFGESAKMASET